MDFDEFWVRLAMRTGWCKQKLTTLAQKSEFEAVMVDPHRVVVMPCSTRKSITLYRNQFQRMWNMMKDKSKEDRCVNRNKRYNGISYVPYLCTLIDDIVKDQYMK